MSSYPLNPNANPALVAPALEATAPIGVAVGTALVAVSTALVPFGRTWTDPIAKELADEATRIHTEVEKTDVVATAKKVSEGKTRGAAGDEEFADALKLYDQRLGKARAQQVKRDAPELLDADDSVDKTDRPSPAVRAAENAANVRHVSPTEINQHRRLVIQLCKAEIRAVDSRQRLASERADAAASIRHVNELESELKKAEDRCEQHKKAVADAGADEGALERKSTELATHRARALEELDVCKRRMQEAGGVFLSLADGEPTGEDEEVAKDRMTSAWEHVRAAKAHLSQCDRSQAELDQARDTLSRRLEELQQQVTDANHEANLKRRQVEEATPARQGAEEVVAAGELFDAAVDKRRRVAQSVVASVLFDMKSTREGPLRRAWDLTANPGASHFTVDHAFDKLLGAAEERRKCVAIILEVQVKRAPDELVFRVISDRLIKRALDVGSVSSLSKRQRKELIELLEHEDGSDSNEEEEEEEQVMEVDDSEGVDA